MVKGDSALDSADIQLAELYQSKEYQQSSEKFKAKVKASSQPGPFGLRTKVLWGHVFQITVLHVICAVGAVVGTQAKWQSYVCYVIFVLFSILGITAGVHRYWSHRSYKARLPYQMLLMCFNCMSWQGSIYWWARNHRLHHKYVDTDADPHNSRRGFFFCHMGWLVLRDLPHVLIKRKGIDMSDLKKDPLVMFQKKYYHRLGFLFCLLIPTFVPWYFWNENLMVSFLFLFGFRYAISFHCVFCINSFAHLWGHRPYDKNSNTAESRFTTWVTYGEGYHNYHHSFPWDYAAGELGPWLNVTTCFIDLCAALGLVYDRKQASQETILKTRRRKGDLSD